MRIQSLLGLIVLLTAEQSYSCPISYAVPEASRGPSAVAYSPDGSFVAVANNESNNVTVFAARGALSDAISYPLPSSSSRPVSLAISSNGLYLATGNNGSNDVTLFSVGKGGVLSNGISYPLPGSSSGTRSVAFSPDGQLLATANLGDVSIFSIQSGSITKGTSYSLPDDSHESLPFGAVFSPDGSYLAIPASSIETEIMSLCLRLMRER